MNKRLRLTLALAALTVFGVLGFINFKSSMTPYVGFAEAKTATRTVQVAGFPDHATSTFDAAKGGFGFTMTNEEGEPMQVFFRGGKPGNFDQAQSVVVIGKYDGGVMEAKQILVKCPSKYEAEAEAGKQHPGADTAPAGDTSSE